MLARNALGTNDKQGTQPQVFHIRFNYKDGLHSCKSVFPKPFLGFSQTQVVQSSGAEVSSLLLCLFFVEPCITDVSGEKLSV